MYIFKLCDMQMDSLLISIVLLYITFGFLLFLCHIFIDQDRPYDPDRLKTALESQQYPPIPEDAQGRPIFGPWPDSPNSYCVKDTDSSLWGSKEEAISRALQETEVTADNERLIRTHHPALSNVWTRVINEITGKSHWLVHVNKDSPHALPTHIAGRELHVAPCWRAPANVMHATGCRYVPIGREINPRRMLTALDIAAIRVSYPTAVGVRVYVSNFAVILFSSERAMIRAWRTGWPGDIGGLRPEIEVLDIRPSTVSMEPGCGAESMGHRVLGLRVKKKDGTEAVTAVTHGFMRLPGKYWIVQFLRDKAVDVKEWLLEYLQGRPASPHPMHRNSSLGQVLTPRDAASASTTTVTVTASYDEPSTVRQYPVGYLHDLSLLTGDDIPQITSPPGVGKVSGWADYTEALDGKPVFVTTFNVSTSKTQVHSRTASIQQAVVEGTEYFWDAQGRISASLFWRTDQDYDHAESPGNTGSVLCLGKPGDENISIVAFQNYETPTRVGFQPDDGHHSRWRMRGGFVLPREIRECEIVTGGEHDGGHAVQRAGQDSTSNSDFQSLEIRCRIGV